MPLESAYSSHIPYPIIYGVRYALGIYCNYAESFRLTWARHWVLLTPND